MIRLAIILILIGGGFTTFSLTQVRPTSKTPSKTTQTATTNDGRTVILKSDGTWKYADEKPVRAKTPSPWDEGPIVTGQRGGFTFEIRKARLAGGNITLYLLITGHEENRGLSIGTNSYGAEDVMLWDDLGNHYKPARNTLAGITDNNYPVNMVPELPIKATVTFEGISAEAKAIASVKLAFWTTGMGSGDWLWIEFRKIPLTQ